MSTRWYPLYQKGNPQLRVFLPNFWMKLIRWEGIENPLPNRVKFHVHMDMTRYDVKNYLKAIYNVDSIDVHIKIRMGRTKPSKVAKQIVKDDDMKLAYVTLPEGQTFTFPNIFPEGKEKEHEDEQKKQMDQVTAANKLLKEKTKSTPGIPGWFAK